MTQICFIWNLFAKSGSGQERTRISRILRIIFRVAARPQISQTWINWELRIDNWKLYHVREWTKVNTNHTNILESLRDRRLRRLFFYLTQIAQIAQIFFWPRIERIERMFLDDRPRSALFNKGCFCFEVPLKASLHGSSPKNQLII